MLETGDRIRVTGSYGARYPSWKDYMGAEGTVIEVIQEGPWEGYVRAQLDCDPGPGLFLPDELERVALVSGFTERPLGLDVAEWDKRDRELAQLMRTIQSILPYKMSTQDKAAFEMALTMHLGGV